MSVLERVVRGVLTALVVLFFLFPLFWVVRTSFQTNEDDPAHPARASSSTPTLSNYIGVDHWEARFGRRNARHSHS